MNNENYDSSLKLLYSCFRDVLGQILKEIKISMVPSPKYMFVQTILYYSMMSCLF